MNIGDKAPEILGINEKGEEIRLSDYKGKKIVLYFYPKDSTSGCTAQACNLRDNYTDLRKAGYEVIGVSVDNEKSHQKFIEKNNLPFTLIADTDKKLVEQFGVWGEKSMYGRKYMGLQFSITAIGTIIVQGAVNVYGETYMAGFSAAGKLQNMIMTVFVAFGATVATYVGQNRGAGRMDRVKSGVRCTQVMILVWSVIAMAAVCFGGKYMTWLFIDPSETEVVNVSVLYFRTVFWCYPFLGSIFLYRNTLQGMGYGLVPMLGGVFELAARSAIVMAAAGRTTFQGVCLADPAAWIAALIPLVPYYFYTMRKWKTTETKIQKQI